ncbi:hypothetical protein ETU10_08500 [Apibacter muscae]|uniref:hypothetical protein n=1 Tax=Apibacter muscae TaxID=2509004 RepID=UPI0011AC0C53|nr:hypothetical protein [Apibacter muscae]TWP23126.1 hypothetical protein ETU10_08500 [Apibacter muscae]
MKHFDIIEFWEKQTTIWNDQKKCGECWDFSAPLVESQASIHQLKEETKCCNHLFLTELEIDDVVTYDKKTGYPSQKYIDYSFDLYVLKTGALLSNNYNEITGYPIEQSNWNKIYKPLIDCFSGENVLDFCRALGYDVQVNRKKISIVYNYLSNIYNGLKIKFIFRLYE